MAKAEIAMDIQSHEDASGGRREDEGPLIKYYRASEALPGREPPLHKLLRKGPAACAAVQTSSGILSFGIGVVFAVSFGIGRYFLTLFRVPIITGVMFVVAGILSNLLYKHPGLLQTCFIANISCLAVSGVSAILLVVDLVEQGGGNQIQIKMEVLVLCVTLMDLLIAAVLVFWFHREKRQHKQ